MKMPNNPPRPLVVGIVLLIGLTAPLWGQEAAEEKPAAPAETQSSEKERVVVPENDIGVRFLEPRAKQQLEGREDFGVTHDFRFSDEVEASGITFRHVSVDDSLKDWMPVHYDHGNGVAAADVDGDGHYDLYLTSQLGGNELWRNRGDGTFENVTERAGVALEDRINVMPSFADVDNDGDADLFVSTVRTGNVLFLNDGDGRFRDVSKRAGVDYVGHSSGAVFFDYDNDGLLDLFLTNVGTYTIDEKGRGGFYRGIDGAFDGHIYPERSERSILYRNLGDGRFEDVSEKVGLIDESWSGDASMVDFDRDLDPDLYVLNMQGDDHYWENQGGKRFVEKTAEYFPKTSWGAMGIKFFDWDNDGRLDLMTTDMHSDMGDPVEPLFEKFKVYALVVDAENNLPGNSFYRQKEDGSFEEISDEIGAENYWPWGLSTGDLNADGFEDVFIASSMNYPFRYAINSVLLNDEGEILRDSEFIVGVEPRRDGQTHEDLFELDCSGEDKGRELCEGREGVITVAGTVGTRSSVIYDLDDDGDLDVVTNEFNGRSQVLVSDLAQKHDVHYLKIELTGKTSNRDGRGARITVTAGGQQVMQYHDGKSGYLSHSSLPLYFGLGKAKKAEKIEVLWPTGKIQVLTDVAANRLIEIVEE